MTQASSVAATFVLSKHRNEGLREVASQSDNDQRRIHAEAELVEATNSLEKVGSEIGAAAIRSALFFDSDVSDVILDCNRYLETLFHPNPNMKVLGAKIIQLETKLSDDQSNTTENQAAHISRIQEAVDPVREKFMAMNHRLGTALGRVITN